ncbi:MAG: hypothetical protein HWN80_02525 [Candidatus Lokiarchaeota archaeon]|nr:hypothetical protein [Candidatus Lokiarchaeota archaeon]
MKLSIKQKDTLFKLFIFGIIEFICVNVYLTISGLAGHLLWSVEQLTTTPEGMAIQILNLIILVDGIVLFVYLLIFVILFLTS